MDQGPKLTGIKIPVKIRILIASVLIAFFFGGFYVWHWNVQRSANLCLRCGNQVVIQQTYFNWRNSPIPSNYPMKYEIVSDKPSVLTGVLHQDEPCSHGLQIGMLNGKLNGPKDGNYLLPVDGYVKGVLGDYRLHWTGIGFEYNIFMPAYENASYDRAWKLRLEKYLVE